MDGFISPFRTNKLLFPIYVANIFLSFHFFMVIYIHSSYLSDFFNETVVSIIFMAGSLLNLLFFATATRLVSYMGTFWYLFSAIALEWLAIMVLAETTNPILATVFFILHLAVIPMILFSLDIYLETINNNESVTGEIRGLYLTLSNITLVISPSIVAIILTYWGFREVFLLSSLFLIPLSIIAGRVLSRITVSPPSHQSFRESLRSAKSNRNTSISIALHFILQFFYGWVVIYLPIYLNQVIGFSWPEIGILFSIMLLPFILFQIPAGYLADKRIGEKEMIVFGFGFIAFSISLFTFPTEKVFWMWASLLFLSRVGASVAEITIESYFFKHVSGKDSGIIGLFRMMRPVGFILAPLTATVSHFFLTIKESFFVLGAVMLIGSIVAVFLEDTLD